ncbi:MAG: adenylate/guanylate cyclase domain-containing protein [Myxococcaceae bacterium]|nr:adenylate/guanylate cyclase domain-containing protein [Myxococcaceae bacterium]
MDSTELGLEELKHLRHVNRTVDDLLEEALKSRENLEQTFTRIFPELLVLAGAAGVAVTSLDEELQVQTWSKGDFGGTFPGTLLAGSRWGVRRVGPGTLVSQALDVVGTKIGAIGLFYEGDRTQVDDAARLSRLLDTIAEQLDTVLASIQTASEKHQLLVTINHFLSNRVFEVGMDQAVRALCEKVRLPGFMLVFRDAVESAALHYRTYQDGQLQFSSNGMKDPRMEAVIKQHGPSVIGAQDKKLREALGSQRAVEAVLISGVGEAHALGKILVWSGQGGFSAYTMDLLRLLASTLSQRLIDYNRERIHLSQFFSGRVIDELLKDPDYERRYLTARAEEVGILFADINGFTKICEQVLERPERIGKFVDDWSEEAVRLIHRHGGVFDKMVGDCVIGLFGPPFFTSSGAERARDAVRAAIEIQRFTREKMSTHPEISRLSEILKLPGLGVAVGVNLAPTFCGLFGPNRQYTGFSTGMNQTARLQSLGGFRETLVMECAKQSVDTLDDADLKALRYGPAQETAVKNVAAPLRYFKLLD